MTPIPDTDRCWHGRFVVGGEEWCQARGEWGLPDGGDVVRAMRWCSAHKHPDDVRLHLEDEADTDTN